MHTSYIFVVSTWMVLLCTAFEYETIEAHAFEHSCVRSVFTRGKLKLILGLTVYPITFGKHLCFFFCVPFYFAVGCTY